MENFTEDLREYLKERRNISKKLYKFMSKTYRAVKSRRITWDDVIDILGGAR